MMGSALHLPSDLLGESYIFLSNLHLAPNYQWHFYPGAFEICKRDTVYARQQVLTLKMGLSSFEVGGQIETGEVGTDFFHVGPEIWGSFNPNNYHSRPSLT